MPTWVKNVFDTNSIKEFDCNLNDGFCELSLYEKCSVSS
jgi:hypothetical protein